MQKVVWLAVMLLAAGLAALVAAGPAVAQGGGEACPALLDQVLTAAESTCGDSPFQAVCAGSPGVTAVDETGAPVTLAPSLPLEGLASITTAPLDPAAGAWGVAVLRVPGFNAGEALDVVLFGDAALTNQPGPPVAPLCNAVSIGTVNIRSEPNTESLVLGQMTVGESAVITARLPDASWYQIVWNGDPAWVFAQLAPADCDPASLLIFDPATGALSGGLPAPDFQGARLESSFAAAACADAPRAGMLVQAASESASWRVDAVTLGLNGTLLLQANSNDILAVYVLEGQVVLEVGGVSRVAGVGQMLRVPLRDGVMASLPGLALDLVPADVALSPLALLPRPVTSPAATVEAAPLPEGADVVCAAYPQQVAAGLGGAARIAADAGQSMRISALGSVSGITVQGPDGETVASAADRVVDVVADAVGIYTVQGEGPSGAVPAFDVTCDLPPAVEPPALQSCEAVLLRWEGVSGNAVRFTASAEARASVVVEQQAVSNGPAAAVEVLTSGGERVGTSGFFVPFADRLAAGPLDVILPQGGEYTVRWDGDPFNMTTVEVLCREGLAAVSTPQEDSGQ